MSDRPAPKRRRRKRWHQRWWAFRLPAGVLALFIGLCVLANLTMPGPVKTETVKPSAAVTAPAGLPAAPDLTDLCAAQPC